MYYRRKVILALLQKLGGQVSSTDFQKLLFLFVQLQKKPSFDFVPYKFGCFSFQSYADKRTMIKYGLLCDENAWRVELEKKYFDSLTTEDQDLLDIFYERYGHLRGRDLLIHVYENYPYYAIHSEIADKILDPEKMAVIEQLKQKGDSCHLFTLGYEGSSLEGYLNRLIFNKIGLVCDVRKNPISMKYGFSKGQFQDALQKMNIIYAHIPELGIDSSKRKNLDSVETYERLFMEYENDIIPNQTGSLHHIRELVENHQRVALTCFERDHSRCHRSRVATALSALTDWHYPISHLS